MKQHKYVLVILIILFSTASCKKNFLEVPDKTVLTRQAYVTDLKTMGDYLNGIYVTFSSLTYNGVSRIYPELVSDNIQNNSVGFMEAQYSWVQSAGTEQTSAFSFFDNNANGLWNSGYQVIRSCNFIIENINKYRNENSSKADSYAGQAYALRAFTHFVLVNTFAQSYNYTDGGTHPGIPYITSSDYRVPVSRQSLSEVYANLISDLTKAIQLQQGSTIDKRFMNGIAAKALLSRVYLFKGDFQSAKNTAREVGATVPIMTGTANYPSKLFTSQETEALFQLIPSQPGIAGSAGNHTTAFQGQWFADPVLVLTATSDISTLLKENPLDARNVWVTQNGSDWNITKFPSNLIPGFDLSTGSYFETIFRSSEMYLTAAECYANLHNEDSARFYTNEIRTRANIPALTSSVTGSALLDSIYKERRKELCFEGLRMCDLLRWKKGVTRTNPTNQSAQTLPYPSNKAISPIPLQDVNISGLSQNPGY